LKILFVMRHPAALRSLRAVLTTLDEREHQIHLLFDRVKPEAHKVLQQFADERRNLTFGSLPGRGSPGWTRDAIGWGVLSRRLRLGTDYLRYLEPTYADTPALRARVEQKAHPLVRRAGKLVGRGGPGAVRTLRHAIEFVERCLEPPPHVEQFLTDFAPDVVVVTHLARDSVQADYVRAAKRLGLHTAYPVFSWDNLTNKGLVHELPEVVLVWNDLQADEAVELHAIPPEQVRVLGAWSYDHWFEWSPSRDRESFCREVGLRADRPIVLYVCSSGFVARDEVAFVRRWLAALRKSEGSLAEAGVVVRPHPRNSAQWAGVSLDDAQAIVWPPLGEEPLEVVSRQNYFDSIYHAAAVVGINTSAQIESAIVGRPVHTVLADEFRETQQGTLHFRYLQADEFGHLYVGRTMDEHLLQLEASLAGRAEQGARNERFVRRFVRPLGLDVPASPLYVDAVEELGRTPSATPDRGPTLGPLVRLLLGPLAAKAGRRAGRRRNEVEGQADEITRIRRSIRTAHEVPVLVSPWLDSETTELVYWIPFLRWIQSATLGLRDRLVVVTRAESLEWYEGIGARQVVAEDLLSASDLAGIAPSSSELDAGVRDRLALALNLQDPVVLLPSVVDRQRAQLASGGLDGRRSRLEFAPLTAPPPPAELQLPDEFVAVRGRPELYSALAEHGALVGLEGLDRANQAAVLARARAFVGEFGAEACLAVLLGRPAVCLVAPDDDSLEAARVISTFLAREPFGKLHLLELGRSAAEDAERTMAAVGASVATLAAV
jgi:hypothetical protein